MTAKEQIFVQEWLIDMNGTRAYKAAYPSCKSDNAARTNASKLLTNANIAAYVRERQEERAKRAQIKSDDVLLDLIEVKNRCMQAVPVKVWDAEKHEYVDSESEYTFDSRGANAALKLLGEHLGMFSKNVNVTGDLNVSADKLSSILEQLGGKQNE